MENKVVQTYLLAFQPIPDYAASEDGDYHLDADAHKTFIESTLAFYGQSLDSVLFLTGYSIKDNV